MWEGEPTTPWAARPCSNRFEEEPTIPRPLDGRCRSTAHRGSEPTALFAYSDLRRPPAVDQRIFSTAKTRRQRGLSRGLVGWLLGALLGTGIGIGLGLLVLSLLHPPPKTVDFESWMSPQAVAAPPALDVPTILSHTHVRLRRPEPRDPRRSRTGRVVIKSTPWAFLHIKGRPTRKITSPTSITLPPGRHHLKLINPDVDLEKRLTVDVKPGEVQERSVMLELPRWLVPEWPED
jgi:hypothetical protein